MTDPAIEVLFTNGEYSEFGILALLRCPSRAWVDEQWVAFVDDALAHRRRGRRRDEFIPWLLARGATRMGQATVHLGVNGYSIGKADRTAPLNWSGA